MTHEFKVLLALLIGLHAYGFYQWQTDRHLLAHGVTVPALVVAREIHLGSRTASGDHVHDYRVTYRFDPQAARLPDWRPDQPLRPLLPVPPPVRHRGRSFRTGESEWLPGYEAAAPGERRFVRQRVEVDTRARYQALAPGTTVAVRFDPRHPSSSQLADTPPRRLYAILALGLDGVIALAVAFAFLYARRRRSRP